MPLENQETSKNQESSGFNCTNRFAETKNEELRIKENSSKILQPKRRRERKGVTMAIKAC